VQAIHPIEEVNSPYNLTMYSRFTGRPAFHIALITLLLMCAFVTTVLATEDWDPRVFLIEGINTFEAKIVDNSGYDGRFSYYMALDPLGAMPLMDHDAFRYQRVIYPLTIWILSLGGKPGLLPWVMILVNVAAISLSTGLLASLLVQYDRPAWIALAYPFFLGTLVTIRGNLTEPLALCWAVFGLWLLKKGSWKWAGVALGVAILTKEIALPFLLGITTWFVIQKEYRTAISITMIGLAPALIWGAIITIWLGHSALSAQMAAMELIPFYGLLFLDVSPAKGHILLWVAIPMFFFGSLGLFDLRRWRNDPVSLIMLANVALLAFMPRMTWWNIGGAIRTVMGLVIASLLYVAVERPRLLPWVAAFWMVSGMLLLPALLVPGD
jgi:hypothetical protein